MLSCPGHMIVICCMYCQTGVGKNPTVYYTTIGIHGLSTNDSKQNNTICNIIVYRDMVYFDETCAVIKTYITIH